MREELEAINAALQDIASTTTNTAHPPRSLPQTTATTNNNARIHPRSLYSTSEPDFATLAQEFPSLQPYLLPLKQHQQHQSSNTATAAPVTGTTPAPATNPPRKQTIDFTNPAACRELTKILLKKDFGVTWDLPEGHLVPPLTNRLNYILWVEDLLNLSSPSSTGDSSSSDSSSLSNKIIRGLDIGCGASCIYPLLGASLLNWHFVGIDVTSEAVEWAQKNVGMNMQLKDLIEVRKVEMQLEQMQFFSLENGNDGVGVEKDKFDTTKKGILGAVFEAGENSTTTATTPKVKDKEFFAFTMCNPPFFEKFEQANSNPSTAFGGTNIESAYPGGEEAFVRNIFEDSLLYTDRVHWFTTMVGKKATLKALRKWLHAEHSVHVVRTTEFFQGQTSRWGVAWSFLADASVANKPIERNTLDVGAGGNASKLTNKRGGATIEEKEKEALQSSLGQQHQVKKRKITGRRVSLHLSLNDSHAALKLLEHIKLYLERSQPYLKCTLDVSQYQLTAAISSDDTAAAGGATGFTVQLLAQQPKSYVLTINLSKNTASNATASNASITAWFTEVVAEIETAVVSHGSAQLIS